MILFIMLQLLRHIGLRLLKILAVPLVRNVISENDNNSNENNSDVYLFKYHRNLFFSFIQKFDSFSNIEGLKFYASVNRCFQNVQILSTSIKALL